MVAPARNRVAAAAAMVAPDLVIFMGILQKKCEGASPASATVPADKLHPAIATRRVWLWLHGGPTFFGRRVETTRARQRRALFSIDLISIDLIDQPLTNLAPMAPHAFSDVIEKPVPLQAFWPLQELAPPLQALW